MINKPYLIKGLTRIFQVTSDQGEAGLGQAARDPVYSVYCTVHTVHSAMQCVLYSASAGLAARYKHTSDVLASHWSVNTGYSPIIGQNSGDLNAWDICTYLYLYKPLLI